MPIPEAIFFFFFSNGEDIFCISIPSNHQNRKSYPTANVTEDIKTIQYNSICVFVVHDVTAMR